MKRYLSKNVAPFPFAFFRLLWVFLLVACSTAKTPERLKADLPSVPGDKPVYSIFLIGDVGAPAENPLEPSLKLLQQQILAAGNKSALIYLGDNIYNYGMPEPEAYDRKIAEGRLNTQLKIMQNYRGRKFIIPGNHDWAQGIPGGWEAVLRQERYVASYLRDSLHIQDENVFTPQGGCPGPFEVSLHDNVLLITINSQWWLQGKERPYGDNNACGVANEVDFLLQLEDIIHRHQDKHILVAGHHPLVSDGSHGGYFPLKKHLFPLTALFPYAYVPLPGLGSIYPLARQYGGISQDIAYPEYQHYIAGLTSIFNKYDNIVYAAGHEHNLQYTRLGRLPHILSGSGCKTDPLQTKGKSLFSRNEKGYAVVHYYPNEEAWAEFWVPEKDGSSGQLVYRTRLYTRKGPAPAKPLVKNEAPLAAVTARAFTTDHGTSKLHNLILGQHYFREWQSPVRVPVLDMAREKGGLIPYQQAGGRQTATLKLRNKSGREYIIRSVNKDPADLLPAQVHTRFRRTVSEDRILSQHPYGALIVPPLAQAAGVLHTKPGLVFVAEDAGLGQYQEDFKNTLAYLEEEIEGNQANEASLGYAQNLVGTEQVLARLQADHDHQVDEKAFARARVLDMVLGDWERQEGQWRWKEQLTGGHLLFTPVPEDRDVAFFKADGLIPYLASRSWASRSYQNFGYDFGDIRGLNATADVIDHTFLSRVTKTEWDQIAAGLQAALSDEVIEEAVKQLPPEIYAISGPEIAAKLKSRRTLLPRAVASYYHNLAEIVDVRGSDKRELFEVKRLPAGQTQVVVFKVSGTGKKAQAFYDRLFSFPETEEVRLYGLGGDDLFRVSGTNSKGAKIRIIGGDGQDSIVDNSRVRGLAKRSWIYDTEEGNYFDLGTEANDRTEKFREVNRYERDYYQTSQFIPRAFLEYNPDDGLLLQASGRLKVFEFRKKPLAGDNTLTASYLPRHGAFRVNFNTTITALVYKYDFGLQLRYHSPQETFNYYDPGNKTANSDARSLSDNQIKYSRLTANPFLQTNLFSFIKAGVGPHYDQFTVHGRSDTNPQAPDPDISTAANLINKYLGVRAFADLVATSSPVNPRIGLKWLNAYGAHWELGGQNRRYTQLLSEAHFFLTPNFKFLPTWALRIGGAHNSGDFQFYQANGLGGVENLRGYRRFRYSGRSTLYTNLEARIPVTTINAYLLPARLGVMVLGDFGKVYQKPYSSLLRDMHAGIGSGLWVDFNRQSAVTATYTIGEEGLFNLECRFRF
ncbi:MAG: metallophosphoesterase [Adhaeribacter sp.]